MLYFNHKLFIYTQVYGVCVYMLITKPGTLIFSIGYGCPLIQIVFISSPLTIGDSSMNSLEANT